MGKENADMGTYLTWNAHASVLIECEGWKILTDPWYTPLAFSSWSPDPAPVIPAKKVQEMAKSDKFCLVVSHLHPDHADKDFLSTLSKTVPIFIPKYPDPHLLKFFRSLGFTCITELERLSESFGPFSLKSYLNHTSATALRGPQDAFITVETSDTFIVHGNDGWRLTDEQIKQIQLIKSKPGVFMGQGGTASGYPLNYYCFTEAEKAELLKAKTIRMLKGLQKTALACGIQKILPYACQARIDVDGQLYSKGLIKINGSLANDWLDTEDFITMDIGDTYIPSQGKIIKSATPASPGLAEIPKYFRHINIETWGSLYKEDLKRYLNRFNGFLIDNLEKTSLSINDIALFFTVEVIDDRSKAIVQMETLSKSEERKKTCRVKSSVLAAVLRGEIPFEDLYTGYLAEWSREPKDHYNANFLQCLIDFGYVYYNEK